MKKSTRLLALGAALAAAAGAHATDLVLRAGIHDVVPKSGNNAVVNVDSNATLSLGGTLFVTPHVAVDLLGALPFKHDINLNGGGKVGSTKQLPPTLGLQWRFLPGHAVDPFVGLGVNYTNFFDKQTTGALAGTHLVLPPSWGLAAQAGLDIRLAEGWLVGLDARYAKISTHAKVMSSAGALVLDVGDVDIDPYVFGLTIGRHFDL